MNELELLCEQLEQIYQGQSCDKTLIKLLQEGKSNEIVKKVKTMRSVRRNCNVDQDFTSKYDISESADNHVVMYTDQNGKVWCFGINSASYLLKSKKNPWTGELLPAEFLKVLQQIPPIYKPQTLEHCLTDVKEKIENMHQSPLNYKMGTKIISKTTTPRFYKKVYELVKKETSLQDMIWKVADQIVVEKVAQSLVDYHFYHLLEQVEEYTGNINDIYKDTDKYGETRVIDLYPNFFDEVNGLTSYEEFNYGYNSNIVNMDEMERALFHDLYDLKYILGINLAKDF